MKRLLLAVGLLLTVLNFSVSAQTFPTPQKAYLDTVGTGLGRTGNTVNIVLSNSTTVSATLLSNGVWQLTAVGVPSGTVTNGFTASLFVNGATTISNNLVVTGSITSGGTNLGVAIGTLQGSNVTFASNLSTIFAWPTNYWNAALTGLVAGANITISGSGATRTISTSTGGSTNIFQLNGSSNVTGDVLNVVTQTGISGTLSNVGSVATLYLTNTAPVAAGGLTNGFTGNLYVNGPSVFSNTITTTGGYIDSTGSNATSWAALLGNKLTNAVSANAGYGTFTVGGGTATLTCNGGILTNNFTGNIFLGGNVTTSNGTIIAASITETGGTARASIYTNAAGDLVFIGRVNQDGSTNESTVVPGTNWINIVSNALASATALKLPSTFTNLTDNPAGTYTNARVYVDQWGRVTNITSLAEPPSSGGGSGLINVLTNQAGTLGVAGISNLIVQSAYGISLTVTQSGAAAVLIVSNTLAAANVTHTQTNWTLGVTYTNAGACAKVSAGVVQSVTVSGTSVLLLVQPVGSSTIYSNAPATTGALAAGFTQITPISAIIGTNDAFTFVDNGAVASTLTNGLYEVHGCGAVGPAGMAGSGSSVETLTTTRSNTNVRLTPNGTGGVTWQTNALVVRTNVLANTTTFTIAILPGYQDVTIKYVARQTQNADSLFVGQNNFDTASNYTTRLLLGTGTGTLTSSAKSTRNHFLAGQLNGTGGRSLGQYSTGAIILRNYESAIFAKVIEVRAVSSATNNILDSYDTWAQWVGCTNAITNVSLYCRDGGLVETNSTFDTIYTPYQVSP